MTNPDNDEPVRASVGGGRWRMGP